MGFAGAACFVAAAVEVSYKSLSNCPVKSFVMWRCTFVAAFPDTSVGPVFFARGGIMELEHLFGREGFKLTVLVVAKTNP